MKYEGEGKLERNTLGEHFKKYEIGKNILEGLDNMINQVLSHPLFDYNGQIHRSHFFMLGLLYSKGSDKIKIDALFEFFDGTSKGLNSDIFDLFVEDMIYLSGVIIPAIHDRKSFESVLKEKK